MELADLALYKTLGAAKKNGLIPAHEVAKIFGVNRRNVHMWAVRRRTTGFPEPKAVYRYGCKTPALFLETDIRSWTPPTRRVAQTS
jgi:hypothetical protein